MISDFGFNPITNYELRITNYEKIDVKNFRLPTFDFRLFRFIIDHSYSKRYGMESGEIIIPKRGHLRCPLFYFQKKKEEITK